jgi:hypothetical protein
MCQPSHPYVIRKQCRLRGHEPGGDSCPLLPVHALTVFFAGGGYCGALLRRTAGAAVPTWFVVGIPAPRDARAYADSRALYPRADRCAPVSINSPVRNAQNIRLTDRANGP